MYLIASGKAPSSLPKFFAGGSLIALNKLKEGCPAVGETLRRLTGKASDFIQLLQLGVSCNLGSEKVIHSLRQRIDEHWDSDDFVVLKVDMKNAFNLVSRQALLNACAIFSPNSCHGLVGATGHAHYCGIHQARYPMRLGTQQGDLLGRVLSALDLLH